MYDELCLPLLPMSPDQVTPEILAELESRLLSIMPRDGSVVSDAQAGKSLAVGDSIYELVKKSLIKKGVIAKVIGKNAGIKRNTSVKSSLFDESEITSAKPADAVGSGRGGKSKKEKSAENAVPFTQHRHADATRKNLPPAGGDAQQEVGREKKIVYKFDPHRSPELRFNGQIGRLKELLAKATVEKLSPTEAAEFAKLIESEQPWLEWAGRLENPTFSVDPVALHIHERVSAEAILRAIRREDIQRDMFLSDQLSPKEAKAFYQHDEAWTNRLILGDSLQVMTSLAKRENLAGKVQMIYIDPPYGVKFSSNWQNEVSNKDVKDKDGDVSREPEMIRAYRDTWHLGVHSYISYLKQRFYIARELLSETGSIFVQISDDNLHYVRTILEEVFGAKNFCKLIFFRTTQGDTSHLLPNTGDYIIWFAKSKDQVKYKSLFVSKDLGVGAGAQYKLMEDENGQTSPCSDNPDLAQFSPYTLADLRRNGFSNSASFDFKCFGRNFDLGSNRQWKTGLDGMRRLLGVEWLVPLKSLLMYKRYFSHFPVTELNNCWSDTRAASERQYVVQTSETIVQRCMLMTTEPGDLILDPTCGSATSAVVAEQWGRRWITIDTSRVAASIARQRLMTSTYEVYKAKDPAAGIDPSAPINPLHGFEYKTVPHIMLKSIARNVALDSIIERHGIILANKLEALNSSLEDVGDDIRQRLVSKFAAKVSTEGARVISDADIRRWLLPKTSKQLINFGTASQRNNWIDSIPVNSCWCEWDVPFDTDPDWPLTLQESVNDYREAWRAKMKEINAAIAANADQEELVDQPIIVRGVTRVTGPFTVESVRPPEISADPSKPDAADGSPIGGEPATSLDTWAPEEEKNLSAHVDRMLNLLRQDGITFIGNKHVKLNRLDRADHPMIHGEGEYTSEGATQPRRVAIVIGPEHGAVPLFFVEEAMRICYKRGYDDLVIAGFSFDAFAQECIQTNNEDKKSTLKMHMAQIRPDVTMGDLLKKTNNNNQIFTVFGQPRSRVESQPDGEFRATLEGVDIYDPVKNQIISSGADKVAAWFVDTDYDGKVFCVCQAFFPDKSAWEKLQRALKATIAEDKWSELSGKVSLPFKKGKTGLVAVKVIDPRGNEVMRIHRLP